MHSNLFFLLKIILAIYIYIYSVFCVSIQTRIACSISVKNVIRILIGIALNLYTALGNINI